MLPRSMLNPSRLVLKAVEPSPTPRSISGVSATINPQFELHGVAVSAPLTYWSFAMATHTATVVGEEEHPGKLCTAVFGRRRP